MTIEQTGLDSDEPELSMVVDFLSRCLPFSELADEALNRTARQINISYFAKGSILEPGSTGSELMIVRKGALELQCAEGKLVDRLGEYDTVNLNGLALEQPGIKAVVIDDALLYILPERPLSELRSNHRQIDRFFSRERDARLRRAVRQVDSPQQLLNPISDIVERELIHCLPDTSVAEAARLMTRYRVSSLLVVAENRLLGILTDRDLRSRVVAEALDYQAPVAAIMTPEPITLASDATRFDAMLLMSEHRIHHIPVTRDGRPVGVLSTSDLVRARQRDPVYLLQKISRETSVAGLAYIAGELPGLVVNLVGEGASPPQVSQFLCVIGDAITRRLLRLAEEQLGTPPVPYAWLAFGSQGRREIALGGDQDNTLLIDNRCGPEERDYFAKLAEFVCDGLNACGYPYCKGKVMATNPEWRLTLSEWCSTVSQWVWTPTDEAVMRVSIFFDLRCIDGDSTLAEALQQHMLETVAGNTIFLAALTRNALSNRPPLGFFRRFVLEHSGEHKNSLDLKRRGILPVVDLVRVHALASKVSDVNTLQRLAQLQRTKHMTLRDTRNLEDAFNFLLQVRLRQQCLTLSERGTVDNHVNPDNLQDMEKQQLRDAFGIIADAQRALSLNFAGGLY